MELVRGLNNLRPDGRGAAVAVGNYDGVHLGHQALTRIALERAAAEGLRAVVLTFEPHPREYFDPVNAPARLMRIADKCTALAALGIDRVVMVRFDARLQALTPDEFIERVLLTGLGARHVVVGEGFRFGCRRAGSVATLRAHAELHGFAVSAVPSVLLDGRRVSSTAVRAALAGGDLVTAARLLGRSYSMSGRVVAGRRLGRELGYATANIPVHRRRLPLGGIYAVRVHGIAGHGGRDGVASLGTRPTIGGLEPLLEAHVFDFAGDLYGQRLEVEFIAKLRDEAKFASLAELVEQMHDDAARARQILGCRAA
jgi:riboflavin kinase/FMN adenylyltransferase